MILLIRGYQIFLSPLKGNIHCIYTEFFRKGCNPAINDSWRQAIAAKSGFEQILVKRDKDMAYFQNLAALAFP